MQTEQIRQQAIKELQLEHFRQEVEKLKTRMKSPWWRRIFPWRVYVTIKRIY